MEITANNIKDTDVVAILAAKDFDEEI
jgi:hypothetical protein